MKKHNKKLFPKIKKKLKGFITDESGKITKKDALGLSAGLMILGGIDESTAVLNSATCSDPAAQHASAITNGHFSGTKNFTSSSNCSGAASDTTSCSTQTSAYGGVINGHYSTGLDVGAPTIQGHCSHGSHGSHGSHSNAPIHVSAPYVPHGSCVHGSRW